MIPLLIFICFLLGLLCAWLWADLVAVTADKACVEKENYDLRAQLRLQHMKDTSRARIRAFSMGTMR